MMSVFNSDETQKINSAKNYLKYIIREKNFLKPLHGVGNLRLPAAADVVIAGGFFASCINDEQYKDIDVYVLKNNHHLYTNLTIGYHEQQEQKRLKEKMMKQNGVGVTTSVDDFLGADEWERSDTDYLGNPDILEVITNNHTKVQYMLTKYETREELLAHFDYKHCKVSYDPSEDKLYINRETFNCIVGKILKINNENTVSKDWRRDKFRKRGWVLETDVEPYANLRALTSTQIAAGYQQIKEKAVLGAFGLLPRK